MQAKRDLAASIVTDFHSAQAAAEAADHFSRIFQQRENPDEMAEFRITVKEENIFLNEIITETGFAATKSEAKRLIKQGGVSIDGEKISEPMLQVDPCFLSRIHPESGKKEIRKDNP